MIGLPRAGLTCAQRLVQYLVGPHSLLRHMNDIRGRSTLRSWHRPLWRMLIIPAPLIIGVMFFTYGWYADRVVARREQTTSGTIVAHEPANHNRYGYTFSVNNQTTVAGKSHIMGTSLQSGRSSPYITTP
jgi:hypothetical protein